NMRREDIVNTTQMRSGGMQLLPGQLCVVYL
ncbi:hypothetical protein A2U01_0066598, partial [Trifolium medium]|nr:hypothetical protein [Trifolium medium]